MDVDTPDGVKLLTRGIVTRGTAPDQHRQRLFCFENLRYRFIRLDPAGLGA